MPGGLWKAFTLVCLLFKPGAAPSPAGGLSADAGDVMGEVQ